jgi:hypothetical protein
VKKRLLLSLATVLAVGLMAGFATTATATPAQTSRCSSCHSPLATVTIAATPIGSTDATTTYHVVANNPQGINGWAIFNGTTKVAGSAGSGADVDLADGITYTVFGVSGDGLGLPLPHAGYASITISPKGPDHTAPTTTSDAKATYAGTAVVHLTALDNKGGSGVASTFYSLDSATETVGTTISTSVLGTHTIEFWSVDASSNVETPHNFASFTVTPAPSLFNYTYKFNLKKKVYKKLKAVMTNLTTHQKWTVTCSKKGVATFKNLPGGMYKLSTTGNTKFKFKAKTVKVGP